MAQAIGYGTAVAYTATAISSVSSTSLDATHFVAAFRDGSSSGAGMAVVGVISTGKVITYGSEYQFCSAISTATAIAKIDSTNFIVVYAGAPSYTMQAIVGTVANGNEISYGSEYQLVASNYPEIDIALLDSTHFVAVYTGASSKGQAKIGTISNGNEIAFGSVYDFNATNTRYPKVAVLDSTHFVISFIDASTSGSAKNIIGVVSGGNTITFGSKYEFCDLVSGSSEKTAVSTIDSTHFVVSFVDANVSNDGTSRIGTVTEENKIAFGSKYVFDSVDYLGSFSTAVLDSTTFIVSLYNSGPAKSYSYTGTISVIDNITFSVGYSFGSLTFSSIKVSTLNATSFVIGYKDESDSNIGKARVGSLQSISSNFLAFF